MDHAEPKPLPTAGFPCVLDCDPATESDGPPGSTSLARTLALLGKQVC